MSATPAIATRSPRRQPKRPFDVPADAALAERHSPRQLEPLTPRTLVDHVVGRKHGLARRHRILTPAIDTELRTMLKGVVSDQGTAELAAIPGYAVAGKTGTAQKPGPNGYIPGAYVATFVGMVPASRPRLLVLVTIDEPHGQIYGGLVAAPAFEQIASYDLQYLEVPPDLRIR